MSLFMLCMHVASLSSPMCMYSLIVKVIIIIIVIVVPTLIVILIPIWVLLLVGVCLAVHHTVPLLFSALPKFEGAECAMCIIIRAVQYNSCLHELIDLVSVCVCVCVCWVGA